MSTEAGGWFLERDDTTVDSIRAYLRGKNSGTFTIAYGSPPQRLGQKLPQPVRTALRRILRSGPLRHEGLVNEQAPFAGIHRRF
ncbi:MAG: hypothetical protein WB774_13130, partial [Xanthobacteraceae bacterium]